MKNYNVYSKYILQYFNIYNYLKTNDEVFLDKNKSKGLIFSPLRLILYYPAKSSTRLEIWANLSLSKE